jgi:hypothetical protein
LFLLPYPWILYVPLCIALGRVELFGREWSAVEAVCAQSVLLAAWGIVFGGLVRVANRRFQAVGG